MRGIQGIQGMSGGLLPFPGGTPDWIKAIDDKIRSDVTTTVSTAVQQQLHPTQPGTPPIVATPPATGYWGKVTQWVADNPGTALATAATLTLILVRMRQTPKRRR